MQKKQGNKSEQCDEHQHRMAQGTFSNTPDRMHDNSDHSGFHAVQNTGGCRRLAKTQVSPG